MGFRIYPVAIRWLLFVSICMAGIIIGDMARANDEETVELTPDELKELTLEELMDVDISVTIVSKKKEKLSQSPAGVFIVTREDIRRSGVTTLPEALRIVPGLQIAQIDANKWAITSRGFNEQFSNKLLVLIDGRSVYTPLFSGVYWDIQDTLLEDVDRIEVVRGPGATVWGANAVNGVINIITRHSGKTQGAQVTAGGGTREHGFGSFRYGDKLGDKGSFRVYGKYFNRDSFETTDDRDGFDDWEAVRGGFRLDWEQSESNNFTLQGDLYDGDSGQEAEIAQETFPFSEVVSEDIDVTGGNVLGRWVHTFEKGSRLEFQVYYDSANRKDSLLDQEIDTVDLSFQHQVQWHPRNELVWGGGYRLIHDNLEGTFASSFEPSSQTNHIVNMFFQNDFELVEDLFHIIGGTKASWNSFTEFEFQPSLRFLLTPGEKHTVWGAVSRAVRTPSIVENRFRFFADLSGGNPFFGTFLNLNGNSTSESEDLTALEMGYRFQPVKSFSFDATVFWNHYENLVTSEPLPTRFEFNPPATALILPLSIDNLMDGESYGVEVASKWKVTSWWQLAAGFTWLNLDLELQSQSADVISEKVEDNNPEYQFNVRSYLDLPYNLELDTAFYFVDDIENFSIPEYTRFDVHLGWQIVDWVRADVGLFNLFDPDHPEFSGVNRGITSTNVPRSAYGKLTFNF